jgi:glycosyltransferase involved in cell wall biosynthesis
MGESRQRVLQVIGNFDQGGDGRVARNLAMALRRDGMETSCVALRGATARSLDGCNEVALGVGTGVSAAVSGAARLRRLIRDLRPTLVHVHGPSSLVFTAAVLSTIRRPPRLWFTWHDSGSVAGASRWSFRWAVERCEHIFGSSASVAQRLSVALDRRAVEVFRNGIPAADASREVDATVPTLAWAARFVPHKDPMSLLQAAAILRSEGLAFRVVLAGGGGAHEAWLADELKAFASAAGLSDIVSFPGWLPDLDPIWRTSAVGVQTSVTEGLSMTLLEQCMAGLAIVATDVGDTSVIIRHEATGLLIPPSDIEALASALRRVVLDRSLRRSMGASARSIALERFGVEELARQVRARL